MAIRENYDVVVIGAGHAGCEAALAAARLGMKTIMFTVSVDSIALMPCNPNIGGTSKGHLVREIDALGGEMGKNIDKTFIQSRMLNESKGPAVHSLRAQADKQAYTREMRKTLEHTEGLSIKQAEVAALNVAEGKVVSVTTVSGAEYCCKAAILCSGTYLKSRCLFGDVINYTGPNGLMSANKLSQSLIDNGIQLVRFKTGTPARIDGRTIDYAELEEQKGDVPVVPFSFETDPDSIQKEQVSCWLTYTNEQTHDIIRANLDRSPLYAGVIEGTGPRYCPSIEDKVVRFSDKNRHQLFLEPEGLYTHEVYIGGLSSSLPEDVQYDMIHTIKGLEHAQIVRNAYAIEYDCIEPRQLYPSLECKFIKGFFSAGQSNGSSGYEEAASQGLMAGINAVRTIRGLEPVVLDRSQAYIGVLIDDLVTKESHEPYRMMTARAEYRLLLRQDNADIRLTAIGHEIGLIEEGRYNRFLEKKRLIEEEVERVRHVTVGNRPEIQAFLEAHGSTPLVSGIFMNELIKRPELSYDLLSPIDPSRPVLPSDVREQVNIFLKYEGYILRQEQQVEAFKKLERKTLPPDLDYSRVGNLRKEAVQKLSKYRPVSIGQASRISGVSPADVSVLLVWLEHHKNSVVSQN